MGNTSPSEQTAEAQRVLELVLAARARGDWQAVLGHAAQGPEAGPIWFRIRDAEAEACARLGQFDRAEAMARELCELAPGSPTGLVRLARTLTEQGDPRRARRCWDEAAERFPGNAAVELGRVRVCLLGGEGAVAAAACRRVIAVQPDSVPAWRELLRALSLERAHADRDAAVEEMIARRPPHPELLESAGDCLLKLRRHEAASACFRRLEREFPDLPLGALGLAAVAEALGDWGGALRAWERAHARFPGYLPAALGLVRARAQVGEVEAARDLLAELPDAERESLLGRITSAIVETREGDLDRAVSAWRSVLGLVPGHEQALSQCALALAASKRCDEAIALLEQARPSAPASYAILSALSEAYRARGDDRAALRWRIRAFRVAPSPAAAATPLLRELLALGRVAAAHGVLRRLRDEFPADPEVSRVAASLSGRLFDHAHLLREIDAVGPEFASTPVVLHLRRVAQTQLGDLRGAARTSFALAKSPLLSLSEVRERLAELGASLADVDAHGPGDEIRRGVHAERLRAAHQALPRPMLLKLAPLEPALAEVLRGVQDRLDRPQELVAYVDAHLDQIKRGTRQAEVIGAVLAHQQRALQELGRAEDALGVLRQTLAYLPQDGLLYHAYLSLYRSLVPRLGSSSSGRVGVLIVSCRPYLERALALRQMLESEIRLQPLIVVGAAEERLARPEHGILTVPCDDGYEGLPRKMALAYEYLRIASNWRGVLKIDDDVFVRDAARFKGLIDELAASDHDYAGRVVAPAGGGTYHFGKCRDPRTNLTPAAHRSVSYCDGGRGYYLSRRALGKITRLWLGFPGYADGALYEDAMVGELARDAGLEARHVALDVRGAYAIDSFEGLRVAGVLDAAGSQEQSPE